MENFIVFTNSSERGPLADHVDEILNIFRDNDINFILFDTKNNMSAWPKLVARVPVNLRLQYQGKQLPLPQIFKGENMNDIHLKYCGDYDGFQRALGNGTIPKFFHLSPSCFRNLPRSHGRRVSTLVDAESFQHDMDDHFEECQFEKRVTTIYTVERPTAQKLQCRELIQELKNRQIEFKIIRVQDKMNQHHKEKMQALIRHQRPNITKDQVRGLIFPQIFFHEHYFSWFLEFTTGCENFFSFKNYFVMWWF